MDKLTNNRCLISQKWSHLLFINFSIAPSTVQKFLPAGVELDTYEGRAYLSIVPFCMSQVRFFGSYPLPFSTLYELNIRTYVKVGGNKGIYFFTLDTDHLIASFVAQSFFGLPYRFRPMSLTLDPTYTFSAERFRCQVSLGENLEKDSFNTWISERYSLFADHKNSLYQGVAQHEPWRLKKVTCHDLTQDFLDEFGFDHYSYHSIFAGETLTVHFNPFTKIR